MKVRVLIACFLSAAMFLTPSLMAQILAPPIQTGSVSGVVRTTTGAPAVGIRVTAMRADAMDDALRAMVSLTQTDATGRYHLDSVPPGRYYIAAGRVDLPTYYPGTLEVTAGTAVSISSATPLSDIDFVIQETSATVPPGRGGRGLRARGAQPQPFPPTQSPTTRGRGQVNAAPFSPQINRVPVAPSPAPPAPAAPAAPIARYRVNANLGTIASQPTAAWWTNAALVARLGLTADQMKKVEATFDQYRQAIVQNTTDLAREEAALSRLLEADPLEPAKTITTQIDKVIQARGELERTNSKMTLEMRQSLTQPQWVQLQMETQQPVTNAARGVQLRANPVRPVTQGRGQNSSR